MVIYVSWWLMINTVPCFIINHWPITLKLDVKDQWFMPNVHDSADNSWLLVSLEKSSWRSPNCCWWIMDVSEKRGMTTTKQLQSTVRLVAWLLGAICSFLGCEPMECSVIHQHLQPIVLVTSLYHPTTWHFRMTTRNVSCTCYWFINPRYTMTLIHIDSLYTCWGLKTS